MLGDAAEPEARVGTVVRGGVGPLSIGYVEGLPCAEGLGGLLRSRLIRATLAMSAMPVVPRCGTGDAVAGAGSCELPALFTLNGHSPYHKTKYVYDERSYRAKCCTRE